MRTQNIFKKVGDILAEINDQYQYLSESADNLNDLELELLSANADFLAEHIKVLKKLNQNQPQRQLPEVAGADTTGAVHAETVVLEEPYNPLDAPIKQELPEVYADFLKPLESEIPPAEIAKPEHQIPFTSFQEPEEEQDQNSSAEAVPLQESRPAFDTFFSPEPQPVVQQAPVVQDVEEEPQVTEDVVPEEIEVESQQVEPERVPTLNELMSAQIGAKPSVVQASRQQVTDLKSIINLNDKLLFIKDLFNGYSLAYSEAIEILNRFDTFDAADNFLKTNYAGKNNWASKQSTADKFYELLDKRFSK